MSLKDKLKKNKWELILFFIILAIGIFFRSYHFSDWLHFEIDQTYDTLLVSPAVENGVSNLPLLGPTAGGGRSLRLGPAFYYMEYLSARIFGDNPVGHAMQILILSILALPLFYFFCRRYFSKELSLGLLAIFCSSLYIVLYSRFSWSPNVLPFLALASFYSFLRSVSRTEKNKSLWFLSAIFLAAIASQIHFSSFFSVPLIFLIFLLIKRPKFGLKIWLAAIFIFLVLYSPVIISDIKTGGQNLKYFSQKLGVDKIETSDSPQDSGKRTIGDKIFQDFRYNALEYFLIVSGQDEINGKRLKGYDAGLLCKTCQPNFLPRISGIILFLAALIILSIDLKCEKDNDRKDFLWICFLWFASMFLFLLFITYDGFYIYPRFFLLISPLAMVFFGFILEKIHPDRNKARLIIFVIMVIGISWINAKKILANFDQLKDTSIKETAIETEDVFPDNARVTLSQQLQIVNYMELKYKANGFPIYAKSIHEFDPVFWYHLEKRGLLFDEFLYNGESENDVYAEGNYFVISLSDPNQTADLKKYESGFNVAETEEFGSLIVFSLIPKSEAITAQKQNLAQKKPTLQSVQISQILTWKKLFR